MLVTLALAPGLAAQDGCRPLAPCYDAEHIVNGASGQAGFLAPYTFGTISGTDLAYKEVARGLEDPMPGLGGVNVLVNNIPAIVFYVASNQVNFLLPEMVLPGEATVQVHRDGVYGPVVKLNLVDYAPAFFQPTDPLQREAMMVLAQHTDWTMITKESPARPGEYAILWATGLGDTLLPIDDYEAPSVAVQIRARGDFKLLLDEVAVEDSRVEYVGIAPPFYGLYQINLKLPENVGPNPQIRMALAGQVSMAGLFLPVETAAGPQQEGAAISPRNHCLVADGAGGK